MTTRPLPLPGWAMRALHEERLTQWRWRLKVQPEPWAESVEIAPYKGYGKPGHLIQRSPTDFIIHGCGKIPFAPGDVLWVREAWNLFWFSEDGEYAEPCGRIPSAEEWEFDRETCLRRPVEIRYRAADDGRLSDQRWRSPVTMPRWASRWTLTVESVRVERVAELRSDDAPALGCHRLPIAALHAFQDYWDARHGPGAWERNDWCAVACWRAERRNVDAD